jgi:2-hydroxychromene-2-carboxylate isomerase
MRIETVARQVDVEVRWRPFLLGPIFKAVGWSDSPFNLQAAKARYAWRDLERICAGLGIPFQRPTPFPQRSVTAARLALIGHDDGWGVEFSKRVYLAEFGDSRDIGEREVLADLLKSLSLDPEAAFAKAEAPETKERLRYETEEAERLSIFGAPSLVTADGELFWGNDRLEQALEWGLRL